MKEKRKKNYLFCVYMLNKKEYCLKNKNQHKNFKNNRKTVEKTGKMRYNM